MNTTHHMRKAVVGALLSSGVALAALGMTAGSASAAPQNPTIDHSDFAGPLVECIQCGRAAAGDGSVRVINPSVKLADGSVRVAIPSVGR